MPGAAAGVRRFVGRASELDTLDDARRELARGRGSFTLIDGEAGIGKSRLVAHALRSVTGGRASRIVTAECVEETHAELYPIRATLAAIWGDRLTEIPALVLRTVAQLLPDEAGADIVQRYAGVTLGKTELFAGLIAALGLASAKRGTILVLEDIHWADRTTLEFLATLAPALDTMRLMIVATCRSETFERSDTLADVISRLLRAQSVRHLALQPLLRTEVAALIDAALAGGSPVSAQLVATIIERAEGNPFFAEELLKAAVEQRAGEPVELPLSIRAGIRHRLAALSLDDRELLEIAAVLGVRFDPQLLAALSGRPPAEVFRTLRAARAAHIIDEVDASTLCFHHALTRETIYESLLAAEAQALHRRILIALEPLPETGLAIEALAYHAWQAGDSAAALRYSERAGDFALERGLFSDARSYYERILPVVDDDAVRARLYERLGAVATAQGDFATAIGALESALTLSIAHANFDDAARIAVALAVERSNSGADAITGLEDFYERFAARMSSRGRNGVLVFLARIMTALDRFARAEELLGAVSAPGDLEPRVRANYFTCRLNMSAHAGSPAAWRDAANAMLALAPELPPLMRSIQLTNVAQTGAWFGEGAITQRALAEAQQIAQHWGFEGIFTFTCAVDAQLAFLRGDLAAARTALDAVARRPDVAPAQIVAAQIGPYVADALDDAGLAARYIGAAKQRATLPPDESIDMLYCDVALLAHAPATAPRTALQRLAARLANLAPGAFFPPTVAAVAARMFDEAHLPALLTAADTAAHGHANPAAGATRDLVRAIAARRTHADASADAERAAAAFRALGWPLFEALARTLSSGGAMRQVHPAPLLSIREQQIAQLVAEGATNATIADRLHIGVKTVEKHVSSILLKLGARSRTQIATFVAQQAASAPGL